MFIIVLNQTNIVQDGLNNKLVYKFPNSVVFKDKYIAVSSVSMYYSWFNITSVYGNNTFTYTWTNGASTSTFPVVIPDGLWNISAINNFIQFIDDYNIPQSDLQVGTYYCPVTFVYSAADNTAMLIAVVEPAQYIKEEGSRLIFKYKNSDNTLPFPSDGHTTSNDARIITADMNDLNTIIQQFSLQFSKEQWTTEVHGYNAEGQLRRISNL
jgi:hypothetical protein